MAGMQSPLSSNRPVTAGHLPPSNVMTLPSSVGMDLHVGPISSRECSDIASLFCLVLSCQCSVPFVKNETEPELSLICRTCLAIDLFRLIPTPAPQVGDQPRLLGGVIDVFVSQFPPVGTRGVLSSEGTIVCISACMTTRTKSKVHLSFPSLAPCLSLHPSPLTITGVPPSLLSITRASFAPLIPSRPSSSQTLCSSQTSTDVQYLI